MRLRFRSRYEAMRSGLDERERRLFAAAEARTAGYGGVSAVARATGIARSAINRGLKDLIAFDLAQQKVRRAGGGRPSLTQTDPTLLEDLQRLLEPATLGDPMRLLRVGIQEPCETRSSAARHGASSFGDMTARTTARIGS